MAENVLAGLGLPVAYPARREVRYAMRSEDSLLFICTRQAFTDDDRDRAVELARHPIDWAAVYATAEAHGVAPLVHANLLQCAAAGLALPPTTKDQFETAFFRNMLVKEKSAQQTLAALKRFNAAGIDVMLIKGAALDVTVYDKPWYTAFDDVDLVLRCTEDRLSEDEAGAMVGPKEFLNLEFDYFEHHDIVMNGILSVDFNRVWQDAAQIQFRGQRAFVMAPEDMLIALCINSCRKRFFRLKSLCDIAETVHKYRDLNWDTLVDKARDYDCVAIVYTALLATQMTVGCELPDGLLDRLPVGRVRAAGVKWLTDYLARHAPLSSFSPQLGRAVFGRHLALSLVLPYAVYTPHQWGRKFRFLWSTRRQDYPSLTTYTRAHRAQRHRGR